MNVTNMLYVPINLVPMSAHVVPGTPEVVLYVQVTSIFRYVCGHK